MTLEKPLWLQNDAEYPASLDRLLIETAVTEGVRNVAGGDLLVHERAAGASMDVEANSGVAAITGDDASFQGRFLVRSTGTETITVPAADATNPRIDLIVARVYDSAEGVAGDVWTIELVEGTPAASPAEPAVPNTAYVLARIDVPTTATSVKDTDDGTNAYITDRRTSMFAVLLPSSGAAAADEVLKADGAGGSAFGSALSGPTIKSKDAAESVASSETFQDDDDLTFAIGANETWVGYIVAIIDNGDESADIKSQLTAPGGTLPVNTGDGVGWHGLKQDVITQDGDLTAIANNPPRIGIDGTQETIMMIWFRVANGATPGSLTLQWAQGTSSATATTLKAGSHLVAHQEA